jgi:hypothetical protein
VEYVQFFFIDIRKIYAIGYTRLLGKMLKEPTRIQVWHDRAAFHFLTDEQEISSYLETAEQNINSTGVLVIGTFSEQGPKKCSGIEIKQYSETTMTDRLKIFFEKIKCITVDHKTPFDSIQNFVFCSFRKSQTA